MDTVIAPSRAMLCMPTRLIFGQALLEDPAAGQVTAITTMARHLTCIVAARKGMSKIAFDPSCLARSDPTG